MNLNDGIITPAYTHGEWEFALGQEFIENDSIFKVESLPAGAYEVLYIVQGPCDPDTTIATVNVFNISSAGSGETKEVCKNQPIDLFSALSGNVDLGGTWYNFTNTSLPNSQPKAPGIPGNYNYTYIADNGVCPTDTSIVTITVLADCDYLSLGEELFTDISVYPNPTSSQLNIVNPSNTSSLKIELLDMNGRTVLVENKALKNASEATLTIDHLEKGIYTLRVYNDEGQKTFKVVKQ